MDNQPSDANAAFGRARTGAARGRRMPMSEAAEILANFIAVERRRRGISQDEAMSATFIAECISVARHERPAGTFVNAAGWARPSDPTIRATYRRNIDTQER